MLDFWHAQSSKLLFPEIEWSKPEQRTHAGKLLIIGGGAGSFHGLVNAHKTALQNGVGEVRVLLPDSLKKDIKISYLTEIHYKHIHTIKNSSNQVEALPELQKQT